MEAAFKNQPGSALMEVWLESSAATVFFETCPIYGNRKRHCLLPPTRSCKKRLEEQSPSSPPARFYSAPSHPRSPPPVAPDARSRPHSPCTFDRRCGGCEGMTERLALREEGSGDDSGRSRTRRVGEEEGDRSSSRFLRYRVRGRRQRRFRLPQIGQVSKKPIVAAEDSSRTSMRTLPSSAPTLSLPGGSAVPSTLPSLPISNLESAAEAFRSPPPTVAPPVSHPSPDPVPPISPPSFLVPAPPNAHRCLERSAKTATTTRR